MNQINIYTLRFGKKKRKNITITPHLYDYFIIFSNTREGSNYKGGVPVFPKIETAFKRTKIRKYIFNRLKLIGPSFNGLSNDKDLN